MVGPWLNIGSYVWHVWKRSHPRAFNASTLSLQSPTLTFASPMAVSVSAILRVKSARVRSAECCLWISCSRSVLIRSRTVFKSLFSSCSTSRVTRLLPPPPALPAPLPSPAPTPTSSAGDTPPGRSQVVTFVVVL